MKRGKFEAHNTGGTPGEKSAAADVVGQPAPITVEGDGVPHHDDLQAATPTLGQVVPPVPVPVLAAPQGAPILVDLTGALSSGDEDSPSCDDGFPDAWSLQAFERCQQAAKLSRLTAAAVAAAPTPGHPAPDCDDLQGVDVENVRLIL